MRLAMTLVVFLVVGVTIAGSLLTALLSMSLPTQQVEHYLPWLAGGGFVLALPVSYVIAGNLMRRMSGRSGQASH